MATRRSPLAYAILALLLERPRHAYVLHRLMVERGLAGLVNIERRNSVQQALERLARDGLVEVAPEPGRRITYAPTEAGKTALVDWVRATLAAPAVEYPRLPVAVSVMAFLRPAEVEELMSQRLDALDRQVSEMESRGTTADLPRVLLLEVELQVASLRAERTWVASVVEDLRRGTLAWDPEELLRTVGADRPD